MTRALLPACAVLAAGLMPCATAQQKEGDTMTFEYGFRHDPMDFVQNADTLQAALVRRHVFDQPNPGDEQILQARIDEILAEQQESGLLSDDERHKVQFTAGRLRELAELGVDPQRPEIERAVAVILHEKDEDSADPLGIYVVRALCLLGLSDLPEVRAGLEHLIARQEEWNGPDKGCPWTPIEHLKTLWYGRDVVDSTELVESVLTWIRDGLNEAGCLSYNDPWGFVDVAGVVELPVAREIAQREVPVILRGQQESGGWGDRSVKVFRALVTRGLLEDLRRLPPLPPDWRVVREIPAPDGRLETLTYDGQRFWVNDRDGGEAIAVSPDDGSVLKRLKLPEGICAGVGWWDGGLGVTQHDDKLLLRLDAETGEVTRDIPIECGEWINGLAQVDGEVWVADGFMGCAWRVNTEQPGDHRGLVLGGPCPMDLAATPDGVWHTDIFAPAIIKSDTEGKLLDWGERPFDGHCAGLAWDGESLWALDGEHKRVCRIEKAHQAR